ncbi:DUF1819 family protein [Mariprofundus ferrooxydans]|uniref:DUF1819 family protein n=1 Tax=Mariprofundus ferrooxydans TaxID=314344 RepID=UPI0006A743B6|nr:DUF1819 family protein [Mariprofundus ferrooxydans]KON48501.1 hypothetical protein AL013_02405 [Mariprofundus ferrooxydans]
MDKYRLSFTTGGLYYRESIKLAELYLARHDWSEVRQKVLAENLLQINTHSSQVRTYREVSSRLQQLSDIELELFMDCSEQDKRYLLWLGVCRYYQFIEQFAVEVLREKFLSMDLSLTHHDYDVFFNRKSEWHNELDALSQSTRNKLRQILFRIQVEAGLLSSNYSIIPAVITPRVAREIFKPSNSQVVIYPISDADLGGLLT